MRTAIAKFSDLVSAPENIIFLIDRFLNQNIPLAEVTKDDEFVLNYASEGRVNDIIFANKIVL